MIRRHLTLTEPLIRAAHLIESLDDLKRADSDLVASAKPTQRPSISRAIARRQRLRREISKWLSDGTRAQHGQLPIGRWGED